MLKSWPLSVAITKTRCLQVVCNQSLETKRARSPRDPVYLGISSPFQISFNTVLKIKAEFAKLVH